MQFRDMGSDGKEGRPPAGLARESSIYSLTFDEFQNTLGGLGKDFGSMNMDELLKSIWTAEETQAMAVSTVGEGSSNAGIGAVGELRRQGSLTLPRTLSRKTVDEVWRDLFELGGSVDASLQLRRQPTLGETTLEEFLAKAGVVREDPAAHAPQHIISPPANTGTGRDSACYNGNVLYGEVTGPQLNSSPGIALDFSTTARVHGIAVSSPVPNNPPATCLMSNLGVVRPHVQTLLENAPEVQIQNGMKSGGIMGTRDPVMHSGLNPAGGFRTHTAMVTPGHNLPFDELGKASRGSASPLTYVFDGGLRGRKCSSAMEKVVEMRQKRMIKNRESAARSRARKQAYTVELEAEVAKLKEKNEKLHKKQVQILELQKPQIIEVVNKQCGSKKLCLRRTQTGPW